jgi:hypothetical protein
MMRRHTVGRCHGLMYGGTCDKGQVVCDMLRLGISNVFDALDDIPATVN